jgi:hypothetical protein
MTSISLENRTASATGLATDETADITGRILVIDGGLTVRQIGKPKATPI